MTVGLYLTLLKNHLTKNHSLSSIFLKSPVKFNPVHLNEGDHLIQIQSRLSVILVMIKLLKVTFLLIFIVHLSVRKFIQVKSSCQYCKRTSQIMKCLMRARINYRKAQGRIVN